MKYEIVATELATEMDVVLACRNAAQMCDFLEIGIFIQRKFSTAISEICRNCLEHAKEGKLTLAIVSRGPKAYLQACIEDKGPGITKQVLATLENGRQDQYNTKGVGLSHSKKLVDYLEINSGPEGTRVNLGLALHTRQSNIPAAQVESWRNYFTIAPPISPYEELKKRNKQLLELTVELNSKNEALEKYQAQLKESMETFSIIVKNIPDKVWQANSDGEVGYCNDEWLRYTGATHADELKKLNWLRFIHKDEAEKILHCLAAGKSSLQPFQQECRIKQLDGQYIWHLLRCEPVLNEEREITSWLGLMINIDEQKRNNMAMERMVEARTKELLRMNTDLVRSNNDLEQFAYVASHDLVEPLRMISTFSGLLGAQLRDVEKPEAHEFMSYINDGAERMKLLIQDLLNYSRVGRKDNNWKRVNSNEVMDVIVMFLEEKITETGAVIHYKDLPEVMVMGSALLQLLQNLITNAIKFISAASKPVINVSAIQQDGFWHFMVEDNGIGIDSKYGDRIFIIFQRLHNREIYSGTGIGLAISRKITDLHGGRIWYESTPGEGTTFHFTLPVEPLI